MRYEWMIQGLKRRQALLEMSNRELADLSGVDINTINRVMVGKLVPSITTIEKIGRVLGLTFKKED